MRFLVLLACVVFSAADVLQSIENGLETALGKVTPDDVTFSLFIKSNPEKLIPISKENATSFLDRQSRIVFIIHGYTDSRILAWYEDMKNAYLGSDGGYQVIEVDWHKLSQNVDYLISAQATKPVGGLVGELITNLLTNGYSASNIVLTGHSLGAHICGFAGKYVLAQKNQRVSKINGLDPAGPAFAGKKCTDRLCPNDAEQVINLHTNAGLFGITEPCGSVDIYANGGSHQPGCPKPSNFIIDCNHIRSRIIFVEAIVTRGSYIARQCRDLKDARSITGRKCKRGNQIDIAYVPSTATGIYYLKTNSREPFGRGNKF